MPSSRLRPRSLFALPVAGLLAAGSSLLSPATASAAEPTLPGGVAVDSAAPALPQNLDSASWLVADVTSGQVLAAQAGSAKRAPASTLKILTALALQNHVSGDVEVTKDDTTSGGSSAGLKPGVRYPSADLISSLFVASANDSALALARAAGGPDQAVTLMNQAATALGATDTRAENVTGLDTPGQLTTPYDLAILARAALEQPDLSHAASLPEMTLTGSDGIAHKLPNTNKLIGNYEGAIGLKTGSTEDAGVTFVGAAERDGHRMVVVLMQAPSRYLSEATALLDWGFNATGHAAAIATLPDENAPTPGHRAAPAAAAPHSGGTHWWLILASLVTVVALIRTGMREWERRELELEPELDGPELDGETLDLTEPALSWPDDQSSSERTVPRKTFAP